MVISLAIALALALPTQSEKPNFTGVWKVNEARTIGTAREEMEQMEHHDQLCNITIRLRQFDFEGVTSYVIDGKERNTSATTSNARWQGRTLLLVRKTVSNGRITTAHESLTLSDDGQRMTKISDSNWSGTMQKSTIVFDRISATFRMSHFGIGSSVEEVKGAWGSPDEILGTSPNVEFLYFNWLCGRSRVCRRSVTFADGKVSKIR